MGSNELNFEQWLAGKRPPLLMGILNVTPDSFSDGGRYFDADAAIRFGLQMIADGASILDVGGESTRPGAAAVTSDEQIARTEPVIRSLAQSGAVLSIDTQSAAVAEAALNAGAQIVNDVSAGRADPAMFSLVARRHAAIVLMHMQGDPQTMQLAPSYDDVVGEVLGFLKERARLAEAAGIARHRILLDVGIGFGKSLDDNLSLLRQHQELNGLGYATVLGTSRKGFIGSITGRSVPSERLLGTAATIAWALTNGADILRVHDVSAMREVVSMIQAIRLGTR